MALKESGVRLVAQDYEAYIQKLNNINKAHEKAFSDKPGKAFDAQAKKTKGTIGGLSKSFSGLELSTVAVAGAFVMAAKRAAEFAKAAADVAAKNEMLGKVLGVVGSNTGYTAEQAAYAEKMVRDMGITGEAAQLSLIKMAQAEIEWSNAADLARIAQDAARIAMTDSSTAFQNMIYGIQTGYSRVLKTMGLTVDFAKAYENLADQLGITTDQLTEQQKVQARVNAVREAAVAIEGAYEAGAQAVAGAEKSLARHRVNALEQWGQIFLQVKGLRVEMETKFWQAMNQVGTGLQGVAEIAGGVKAGFDVARDSIGTLINEMLRIREGEDIWTEIARRIHGLSLTFVQAAAMGKAFFVVLSEGLAAIKGGPLAIIFATSVKDRFSEAFQSIYAEFETMFPAVFTKFEDLGRVEEVSLDRGTEAIEQQTAALKEQQAALEKRAEILKQVEQIHVDYQRAVADEERHYAEEVAKYNQQLASKQLEIEEKHQKNLRKLEEEAARKEADIRADYARQALEDERKRNMELQHERERYQLSQLQSLRRFQQSEKWLRAEGDILGLMRLREDYALQQQEEQENRDLQLRQDEENYREQQRLQQEEFQRRLEELRQETERRRQEVQESYLQELRDLQEANAEQRAEMERAHQERLQDAIEARNRNLEDLGRALQAEGEITKEGMAQIAAEIGEVFGDQGAADALISGWSTRAESAIAQTLNTIAQQMSALNQAISALESGTYTPAQQYTPENVPWGREPRPRYGMRTGGSGIITGPAVFEVEPGVTEAFSFVPLASQSTINARVSGGITINGAEGASPGVVDEALERVVVSIEDAVKRLGDRRSNN
jgi:hypothetical protein